MRREGLRYAEIGEALSVSADTARGIFRRADALSGERQYRPTLAPILSKGAATEDKLAELLEALAPRHYFAPDPVRVQSTPNGNITFVASDFHFGYEDERCIDIFLQMVADARPGTIVLNGDLPDLLAVSRFPKDWRQTWSLADEKRAMGDFLWKLYQAAPGANVIETNANHSGNGAESRWQRYLSERLGELANLPGFIERVGYDRIWYPDGEWCKIKLVDNYTITKGLIAIHGDVVRGKAGASAMGMLEKYRVNLIHGHTHRMAATGYRVPAIGGQKEHQMRAYEGGCMCKLSAPYGGVMNWQQGFSIVRSDGASFGVEQVQIHEGVAVSTTLGATYRAQ